MTELFEPGFYVATGGCLEGDPFYFKIKDNGEWGFCIWGLSYYCDEWGYRTLGIRFSEWREREKNRDVAISSDFNRVDQPPPIKEMTEHKFDRRGFLAMLAAAPAVAAIPNLISQAPVTKEHGLAKGEGIRPNALVLLYDKDKQVLVKGTAFFEITRRYIEAVPPLLVKKHGDLELKGVCGIVVKLDESGEVYDRPLALFDANKGDSLEVQITIVRQGWDEEAHEATRGHSSATVQEVTVD